MAARSVWTASSPSRPTTAAPASSYAWPNFRFGGSGRRAVPPALVDARNLPFAAIEALDRALFPAPRPAFLAAWLAMPASSSLALVEDGGSPGSARSVAAGRAARSVRSMLRGRAAAERLIRGSRRVRRGRGAVPRRPRPECGGHGDGGRPRPRPALRDGADVSWAWPPTLPLTASSGSPPSSSAERPCPSCRTSRPISCALRPGSWADRLLRVRRASPFVLRTVDPPVGRCRGMDGSSCAGSASASRSALEGELWLVLHLMIAGRLHWRAPGATLAGRNALLAASISPTGTLVLTEAGAKRRASLHLVAGEAALAAHDPWRPGGARTRPAGFRRRSAPRKPHPEARAHRPAHSFAGIGNAYSDEILHAARLSPLAMTQKLDEPELARALRGHPCDARPTGPRGCAPRRRRHSRRRSPPSAPAWRCTAATASPARSAAPPVQRIRYAENETNYCPRCQTGGRLLADRAMSRLLKTDWPRTIDELEAGRAATGPDGR